MARAQPSNGKQAANYLAAGFLALMALAWLGFLGWGAWSLIVFVSQHF